MMVHLSSCMHFLEGDANITMVGKCTFFRSQCIAISLLKTSEVFYNNSGKSENFYSVLGKVDVLKTEGRDGQIEIFIALIH